MRPRGRTCNRSLWKTGILLNHPSPALRLREVGGIRAVRENCCSAESYPPSLPGRGGASSVTRSQKRGALRQVGHCRGQRGGRTRRPGFWRSPEEGEGWFAGGLFLPHGSSFSAKGGSHSCLGLWALSNQGPQSD